MSQDKDTTLMKNRSSQSCIKQGYLFFTNHFKKIFTSTWPIALGFAIIYTAACALPIFLSPALLLPAFVCQVLAVLLLLFFAEKRLVKHDLLERVPKADKRPWAWARHLGMVLLVWFFCLLIVMALSIVTTLPMLIVLVANYINQIGTFNGDLDGMPSYMFWLTLIVFLIAAFIQAYVWLTIIHPVRLMHGSIAQKEKERNGFIEKEKI